MNAFLFVLLTLAELLRTLHGLTITMGRCEKNISVKYQVPVTRMRPHMGGGDQQSTRPPQTTHDYIYVDYEDRVRWDVVHICCPGYRTIIFGLCEALCSDHCPPHSHCVEPNKCECQRGYDPSHHPNKQHQLICRPTCAGGCPTHSHCVAPGVCECRVGFRDTSAWFSSWPRCERIKCGAAQRYDVTRRSCVREMNIEEMMQQVGERLANGLQAADGEDYYTETEERDDDDDNVIVMATATEAAEDIAITTVLP